MLTQNDVVMRQRTSRIVANLRLLCYRIHYIVATCRKSIEYIPVQVTASVRTVSNRFPFLEVYKDKSIGSQKYSSFRHQPPATDVVRVSVTPNPAYMPFAFANDCSWYVLALSAPGWIVTSLMLYDMSTPAVSMPSSIDMGCEAIE